MLKYLLTKTSFLRRTPRGILKNTQGKSRLHSCHTATEEARGELHILKVCFTALKTAILSKILTIYGRNLPNKGICLQRKKGRKRKIQKNFTPYTYKSTDGFYIYVGKNNVQNDFLTLKFASSNDIWLHTKNIPGSHVIIRKDRGEIPDSTLFQAAHAGGLSQQGKEFFPCGG